MKMINVVIAAIFWTPLLAVGQSTASSEGAKANPVPRSFVVIDKNKDGHISREEAQQAGISTLSFDTADKDKDGRLNLSEWTLIKF